ncbi:ubiquinone biosynthesis protein UbiJ [Formivibrio citricus]|uniref:Ubiquinone biosynthesis protein UbiJ n=2 Tax=Formivibrio citricus TaxID=83765 RepID=A0A1I4VWP5_9NEIS|nr:ubiquinone biosynthesis protein UbiJ [Formivibrio citricus]
MLAAVLNRLLAHSPVAQSELAAQSGCTVRIETPLKNETLVMMPDGLLAHSEAPPEATLVLSLSFFIVRTHDPATAAQQIELSGDAALGGRVAHALSLLRWDAAEDLSELVGDVLANRLVKLAGVFGGIPGAIGGRLVKSYAEYLRDERGILAHPVEVGRWANGVNALSRGVTELENRVQHLE